MTGPECYEAAERLLNPLPSGSVRRVPSAEDIAKAQVYATLALAAATAESIAQSLGADPKEIAMAWSEAIS